MRTRTHSLLLLGILATMNRGFAIDPHRAMSQYVRDRWGTEQGFPRGPVYSFAQTSDGYLWIGTEAGLVRFDGLRFVLVRDPSRTQAYSSVIGLAAANDGSLWVRLRGLTLLQYRGGEFRNPFKNPDLVSNITAMSRTAHGELLAAKMQLGAFTYRDGELALLAAATGVPRSPVLSVAMTGDGAGWLGTRGAGLFRLKGGVTSSISNGLPDPKVDCLLPDGEKGLWIGTDNGLAFWDGAEITTHSVPAALSGSQILSLAKDRDSNLWIGTDSGSLLRYNSEGVASLDKGDDDRSAVTALFEDREGNIWVGSAGGIERFRDSAFVTYSSPEGVPTDGSTPIFVDGDLRTWFAPATGGLWWLKSGHHGSIQEAGLAGDIVYSIAGRANDLWAGRQRGGLTRIHSANGTTSIRTYTKADGLAQDSVYSVYLARSGALWAGTISGGVSRLDHETFTTYTIGDGLASNTVVSILEAADGTMWFATPSGLSSLAESHWRTFGEAEGLPSDNVNCLMQDSKGVLWAGTAAGLAFRDANGFATPGNAPAALREQILGMAEDRLGFIWMTTSNHVLRVNRANLLAGSLGDGDMVEYGIADGLRGVAGVKRHRSVTTDALGQIWMSLNRGISVVNPALQTAGAVPAIPHIQSITADGTAIPVGSAVHIAPGHQRMVFGYAGLILSAPERVRFRYRLESYDRDWSVPAAEREAIYTNLGPGKYRLRVMATNAGGYWSGAEDSLTFWVDPEFWQTWWFRAAVLLSLMLMAVLLYRLRLRQATATLQVRFEERLDERTRIARELHDTLLQSFQGLILRFQAVYNMLPGQPERARQSLESAIDRAADAITEGRDAVQELRGGRLSGDDLVQTLTTLGETLRADHATAEGAPSAVTFRVLVEGTPRNVHPTVRDDVYRIAREALGNAFRHAQAHEIEADLRFDSKWLRLRVRDDGRGMNSKLLAEGGREGHWGLPGMRERARNIGAQLDVWSELNRGTEIEVTIPAAIAYRDVDDRRTEAKK